MKTRTTRTQQPSDRVVTFTNKKRNLDMNQPQITAFRWIRECFRFRGTVIPSVLPQMVLAFLIGIFANALKIQRCGENVMEDKECDVAFSVEGHTSVAVVLSFLLVFRVNLAYEKWDEAREAIERVRDGVRNLNVAFCSFVCTASSASFASIGDKDGDTVHYNQKGQQNNNGRTCLLDKHPFSEICPHKNLDRKHSARI